MALQQERSTIDNFGINVTLNCYIKVIATNVTKQQSSMAVCFQDGPTGRVFFTEHIPFTISLDGPNPIRQAYLYLKTLPEFADAVDC
jgi:hypothetical protein